MRDRKSNCVFIVSSLISVEHSLPSVTALDKGIAVLVEIFPVLDAIVALDEGGEALVVHDHHAVTIWEAILSCSEVKLRRRV